MSQPVPVITVESIMTTQVRFFTLTMNVREAIGMLVQHKISGAPLVDGNQRVISVVTEGDLMKLAATAGIAKELGGCLDALPKTDNLITAKRSDKFADVYRMFLTHRVHRVIVVDANGKLQGLVSRTDVLKVLYAPTA
ncbi:MAG: CBS domain-containing protein [Bdellovibrionota bacterium]